METLGTNYKTIVIGYNFFNILSRNYQKAYIKSFLLNISTCFMNGTQYYCCLIDDKMF